MAQHDQLPDAIKIPPGRKFIQFITCLGLAIIFWIFHALSSIHRDEIVVYLHYDIADNKINVVKLPGRADIDVEARGWELLKEIFIHRELTIDLESYSTNANLLTNVHSDLFGHELPETIHILHIAPDTLHLSLEDKITRKLPVRPDIRLALPGRQIIDSLRIDPDSILITGASSIVNSLNYWETERIKVLKPDTMLRGVVALQDPENENIRLSAIAIGYEAVIALLNHFSFNAVMHTPPPAGKEIVLQVTYDAPVSGALPFGPGDFDFTFAGDSINNQLHIQCTRAPLSVQNIKIEPAFIQL